MGIMASHKEAQMASIEVQKRTSGTMVRLKVDVDALLRETCRKEGRTMTAVIERALMDYFKKKRK